jgi:hypothetical protein
MRLDRSLPINLAMRNHTQFKISVHDSSMNRSAYCLDTVSLPPKWRFLGKCLGWDNPLTRRNAEGIG